MTPSRHPAAADLTDARWRKAQASGTNGNNCIELARIDTEAGPVIALRDSKNPTGPVHVYSRHELACFLAAAKAGQFDDMAS